MTHGNILAVGSSAGEVRLFDVSRQINFYSWVYKKNIPINAAQFHSEESSWLFTASKVTKSLLFLFPALILCVRMEGSVSGISARFIWDYLSTRDPPSIVTPSTSC